MKRIYLILTFCALTVSSMFAAASFQYLQIDPNGGTNTMPAHNLIYDVGASFVLTPPVRAGYTFAGWTGDGTEFISRNSAIQGSSSEELTFDGVGTCYNLGRALMYTTKITVNFWAYMDNWADYGANTMRMISCTQGGGWGIESSAGAIQFTMRDGGSNSYKLVTSSTLWSALSAGWHMFTMTFDGRNMYGYVDGVMHGATNIFKGEIAYNATNVIQLGAEAGEDATPAGSYFKGKIKDLSIVKCWMTSSEVSSMYNHVSTTTGDNVWVTRYYMPNGNKSLQATWVVNAPSTLTIDANGGTNTMESATYNQAAGTSITITNPTKAGAAFKHWDAATSQYISNYQGMACSSPEEVTFDGTSTYYDLGRTYMYEDLITVNIWAYMDNWGDYVTSKTRLISCTQGGGWNWELNGSKIRAAVYDSGKGGYNSVLLEKTWASLSKGWHMFTLVFDGSRAHAYIDGEHVGQSEPFQGRLGYNAANSIILGGEASSTSAPDTGFGFFKGKMKNVSIMHTAIAPEDVAHLYANSGVARYYFPSSATTLKAVWEGTTSPSIAANTSAVNFETIEGTAASNQFINVSAANITGNITATLSGADASAFSVTPSSLGSTGGTITISYKETAVGSHTATLVLSATGAENQSITLKGVVNAKAAEQEKPTGTVTAEQTTVTLSGIHGQSPAPYADINVTATGLTQALSVSSSVAAITTTTLADWNPLTGGTVRITLNTAQAVGEYGGVVTIQSASAVAPLQIQVSASIAAGATGPITANPMSVELTGTYGSTEVVYADVVITATGLTSAMSVASNTSSITLDKLTGWDDLTGGTVRFTLNTNFSLGPGEYTEFVAVQSGKNRIEIATVTILKDPNATNPDDYEESDTPESGTPSYDFSATPTLTKVWETSNVLASANARYGTGYDGKVYAVDNTSQTLYSWDSEGCQKTQVITGFGGSETYACIADDGGNILTSKTRNAAATWQAYNIASKTIKEIAITMPSGVTSGLIDANVVAVGDVLSAEGGTIYMAPHTKTVAAKIVVKNGVQDASSCAAATYSGGTFSVEHQLAVANVDYSALGKESFIWRERTGDTKYISGGTIQTYTEPSTTTSATGFATFKLNNIEYGIVPSGTGYSDGFTLFTLNDGKVIGARTQTGAISGIPYASFHVEKVSDGEVNIYFYKSDVACGMYTFAYPKTNTGGVTTDTTVAENALFGYYTVAETLYVTGVTAKTIALYNVTGQKVCKVEDMNEMSVANLQGVYVVAVTDVNNVVYTGKIIVK